MSLPEIVSSDEWLAARRELLVKEKAHTRARDALSADRRRLPMVEVTADHRFTGPGGEATLLDLFAGRRQLIVGHFMFEPEWEDGCPSCSAGADEMSDGLREHLHARDTEHVYVSLAPIEKIQRYKEKRGWTFPWFSSFGSDFNRDFRVTLDPPGGDRRTYNFAPVGDDVGAGEMPGTSVFLRDGERVFHTYSSYARGAEWTGGSYAFLDLTALGRQEAWEEPHGRADLERSATPDFAG